MPAWRCRRLYHRREAEFEDPFLGDLLELVRRYGWAMVIDNRRGAGIKFLAAECGRSVYPLKVAEPSRRRCTRCEATLPHPEAA